VPESEVKRLKARIRELERTLGKKSLQVEILEEALEIARENKLISRGSSSDEGEEPDLFAPGACDRLLGAIR